MFLGEDLLPYLVLAFGGALFVGNVLALLRPPPVPSASDDAVEEARPRPPVGRTLLMASIGLVAAIWAIASLTT